MRWFVSAVVAVLSVALLAGCAFLAGLRPGIYDDDHQQADERMEEIGQALNGGDASALKAMFSPYALERAVDFDARLENLLSLFAAGGATWKLDKIASEGHNRYGEKTELLKVHYTVTAQGKDYELFFADFTINEVENPRNTGIYAMGVMPSVAEPQQFGPERVFSAWAGSMSFDESDERWRLAYPGIYLPVYDSPEVSNYVMTRIVEEINSEDDLEFESYFAEYARTALAGELEDQVDELFALLGHCVATWERLEDAPLARRPPDGAGEAVLLLPTYQVSSCGQSYWVSLAVFTMNEIEPSKIGIYAVSVARRTPSGDSPGELALFAWRDSLQVETTAAPGVFIAG